MYRINHADIKKWAAEYKGELFDAVLCDPPYEISFMQKSWDGSGIAHDVEMWADIYKLLKPGGHLLAFSGSRTYHRMAVAIEDAGFEIRDQIIWMYGSGFPKSLNIGKAVDKIQGNEREDLGVKTSSSYPDSDGVAHYKNRSQSKGSQVNTVGMPRITKGTSEWEGYGTALKPAHEPCVLARKPLDGTVANNCLKWGTGGLNIDGSRVAGKPWASVAPNKGGRSGGVMGKQTTHPGGEPNALGRFPANLILSDDPEVEAVFPQTTSAKAGFTPRTGGNVYGGNALLSSKTIHQGGMEYGDSGSASRYFYCAKASKSERNAGLEGLPDIEQHGHYAQDEWSRQNMGNTPDAKREPTKNNHPTVKPLSLTKYLANLIKPPTGGRLLVPFSGSGSEMIGALQAGWEYVEGVELTEEYIPIAEARIKYWLEKLEEESKQVSLI